ncbi:hypothetical protein BDU57DRAFT_587612 [Ampelomyces quisqualis]|uniref:HAD-like domain-containing protein n=1 Tax=Ampelomyces quisqualis TaxID=50730 RepID=A0A6A5QMV3_AMPQU|nr:hypothetical protein BDU57DRAFT_587612 [Ampelomyces quisqualis]
MYFQAQPRILILDLGDVLFHWTTSALTALSPSTFHAVVLSPTWGELECGNISEDVALKLIGEELSLDPEKIREAISQCRKTLSVDLDLIADLAKLKEEMKGTLKIYAMTNIARDDFTRLKATLSGWSLFDGEYTHVLERLDSPNPKSAIFVDDKVVNVTAAQSFGMQGIVFESAGALMRELRNLLFDPVMRARQYMAAHAHEHHSQLEDGKQIRDSFSQFLIYDELHDVSIISLSPATASAMEIRKEITHATTEAKTWNYFIGPPWGTTSTFPDDVDDTAYALLSFSPPAASANPILDRFLVNRHSRDGLVQIYFDKTRPRVCPTVLVNVVRVFYHYKRGSDVRKELQHVGNVLLNRGYVNGAAQYLSAEPFLFFFARLVEANPDEGEIQYLRAPLMLRLRERVGRHDDSFAVATRVLACQAMGVWAESDVSYLKKLQEADGG